MKSASFVFLSPYLIIFYSTNIFAHVFLLASLTPISPLKFLIVTQIAVINKYSLESKMRNWSTISREGCSISEGFLVFSFDNCFMDFTIIVCYGTKSMSGWDFQNTVLSTSNKRPARSGCYPIHCSFFTKIISVLLIHFVLFLSFHFKLSPAFNTKNAAGNSWHFDLCKKCRDHLSDLYTM